MQHLHSQHGGATERRPTLLSPDVASPGGRLNVLLVQPLALHPGGLCQQLEELGGQTFACDDKSAFSLWAHAEPPFDLTIIDCTKTPSNGYELTRSMRRTEQDRALRPHPVLGLYADDRNEFPHGFLKAGMTRCLFDPVAADTLSGLLRETFEQARRHARADEISDSELHRLKVLCPQAYERLVKTLVRSNREDAISLQRLALDQDAAGVLLLVHKIKGAALLAGATDVLNACLHIETTVTHNPQKTCLGLLQACRDAMDALERQLIEDLNANYDRSDTFFGKHISKGPSIMSDI